MKGAALTGSTAVALLLVLAMGSSGAQDCQTILDQNLYRCRFNQEGVGRSEGCVQFSAPGSQSAPFDLTVVDGDTYGCTCRATGTVAKPSFNASREFLCVQFGVQGDNPTAALEGTVSVNGKKIRGGYGGTNNGDSVVFECELAPACQ
jgi:hypothetical protein